MRGKLPDCSRGFSPAAAAQYIQRLQEVGKANEAFSKRNGELTMTILHYQEDLKTVQRIGQDLSRKLRVLREENMRLRVEVRDLTDEIDDMNTEERN